MYDLQLKNMIKTAVSRLHAEMVQTVPFMAKQVANWSTHLSGTANPEDYFLHPMAFPMLLLPWWLEKVCQSKPEPPFSSEFQSNLVYSTINGYYYIRLIDNVMDGDDTIQLTLLPSLNFFHTQFQFAYQTYFPAEHPFWELFKTTWFHAAESAMKDATLTEINELQFKQIAAQKVCAGKIPMAAVCYYYDRPDLLTLSFELIDLLGCWHQMMNDLFDWHKDLTHQTQTYFLSQAQQNKTPTESIADWVAREGFSWGSHILRSWMDELKILAHQLQCKDLLAYLDRREALFLDKKTSIMTDFETVNRLLEMLKTNSKK